MTLTNKNESMQAKLERLVSFGYVLHGSPMKVEILLPQAPPPVRGDSYGQCPARVCATTKPRLAMFYAAVRGNNAGKGYVYICPPETFTARSLIESFSPVAVKPALAIPVDRYDFAGDKPFFEAVNDVLVGRY